MKGVSLAEQIANFVENYGAFGVVGVCIGFLLIVFLIFTQQIRLAVYFFIASLVLSLLREPFHTLFDMCRWAMVFAMIPLGIRGVLAGRGAYWIWILYALIASAFGVRSQNFFWSLQLSLLFLAFLFGFGGTVYRAVRTPEELLRLLRYMAILGLVAALLYGVPAIIGAGGAIRFTGLSLGTGQVSWTGGILLPFMVWWSLNTPARTVRFLWQLAAGLLAGAMLLTTSRAGILLAVCGCGYLLSPVAAGSKRFRSVIILGGLAVMLTGVFFLSSAERQQYIVDRFTGQALGAGGAFTGRERMWQAGLDACMETPLLGHGHGSADLLGQARFGRSWHNSYLSIWYATGIIGPILVISSMVVVAWRARKLIRYLPDPAMKSAMRLITGLMVGLILCAFVENSLAGRANLTVATVMLAIVCVQRASEFVREGLFYYLPDTLNDFDPILA